MTDSVVEEPRRVSTIELFLDLVFVFAVTQLTALLAEHPDLGGLLQTLPSSASCGGSTAATSG